MSDRSDSNWTLADLGAGTYVVRMVKQAGWTVTAPTNGVTSIILAAGQTKTGVLFGERHI